MISVVNNVKLLNAIVSIERDYISYFGKEFVIDYENLYKEHFDVRLCQLCSSLHYQLVENLKILNDSINGGRHFWAIPSRNLIKAISLSNRFVKNLKNSGENVCFDEYYGTILKKCDEFLSSSGGSPVPADMLEIEIYYELPIFEVSDIVQMPNNSTQKFQLRPIGSGSYATVFRYFDENYNKYFALKRASEKISTKDLERFYLEYETMKKLSSPYILEVYSIDRRKNEYVMEYADTSLFNFIRSQNQKLTFEDRKSLCNQIIKGFEYLTKKEILHRDISPNNILIKEYEDIKVIKIADLGNVKLNDSVLTSLDTEIRGAFNDYSGLQRIGFSNYNFFFEGFALSKLLYFVLTGRYKDYTKFEYQNLEAFINKGTDPNYTQRFEDIYELKLAFSKIRVK
ncbi:protein kinase family protein [Streptococcus suis]|uniref:protein kinase family protein n=1 Tax=Streptococcus suis TaxID=1307 RepID=UPI0005D1749C|nr:protein kinase family protein [Streptococcus suis]MBS8103964.1 protein kinase family protein [Streptococcus suis]MDG3222353.1 protein kinase family protein [Streptococcus suis]NRH03178.1 protein kinase family protein [Streptococcus suis]CYY59087.1 serine/threonine protein kinase [Streptococcus suis]CYZ64122.1 serine/threonine protein kinase [Streptococcus suis]